MLRFCHNFLIQRTLFLQHKRKKAIFCEKKKSKRATKKKKQVVPSLDSFFVLQSAMLQDFVKLFWRFWRALRLVNELFNEFSSLSRIRASLFGLNRLRNHRLTRLCIVTSTKLSFLDHKLSWFSLIISVHQLHHRLFLLIFYLLTLRSFVYSVSSSCVDRIERIINIKGLKL